jgi:tetratricopeptide (TPR) repeat protein
MKRFLMGACAAWLLASANLLAEDLETGRAQFEKREFAKAEATLRAVVEAEPDNLEAIHYLGMALIEQKKYKEAENVLEKAARNHPQARVDLAKAQMYQEKLDPALRTLEEAEKDLRSGEQDLRSAEADLHLTRGMILLKRDRFADAAKELSRTLELEPKNAYAHYYMGMAQSRLRRPDLMAQHFEIFLQLEPNSPEAARVRSLLRSAR